MKICFFALDLTYKGGVSKLSVELVKHLSRNSDVDEILVVCDSIDEEVYKPLKHEKIRVKQIERMKRSDLIRIIHRNITYAHLSDELKGFDVFHVLDNRALPLVNPNVHPLVVTIHDVMLNEFFSGLKNIGLVEIGRLAHMIDHYPVQWFLEFLSVAKAHGIIVNSAIVAKRLEKRYGDVGNSKIRIIPAGFDPKRFNPHFMSKSDAKRFLKLGSSSKVLLHVGGDAFGAGRKGLPYLLHALDYMRKNGQLDRLGIKLIVLGKVAKKWMHMFSSLKDHVRELPYVTEDVLPIFYRAADLLVMPSLSEGWGIALIEALACATPVVASLNVPSAFATKNTGAVYIEPEVNNPKRFAKSILEKLENDYFGANDWNKIFNSLVLNYSWENFSNFHVKVYEELLDQKCSD